MNIILPLILFFSFHYSVNAANCADNWVAFGDEKCYRLLPTIDTHKNAISLCQRQPIAATLASVRSQGEQDFLENYIFVQMKTVDSVWLGGNRTNATVFSWEDGFQFGYTNWQDSSADQLANSCVEMQTELGFAGGERQGKWIAVSCEKKNLVLCEYQQNWTLARLQSIVIALKYINDQLNDKIKSLEVNSVSVPVGFVYTQLSSQPEPKTLWPGFEWKDISSAYAGLFFRVSGGNASAFGTTQEERVPGLADVTNTDTSSTGVVATTPTEGTAIKQLALCYYNGCGTYHHLLFNYKTSELAPRNQAIRVWQRSK